MDVSSNKTAVVSEMGSKTKYEGRRVKRGRKEGGREDKEIVEGRRVERE